MRKRKAYNQNKTHVNTTHFQPLLTNYINCFVEQIYSVQHFSQMSCTVTDNMKKKVKFDTIHKKLAK